MNPGATAVIKRWYHLTAVRYKRVLAERERNASRSTLNARTTQEREA
jgi:hypothetical protein